MKKHTVWYVFYLTPLPALCQDSHPRPSTPASFRFRAFNPVGEKQRKEEQTIWPAPGKEKPGFYGSDGIKSQPIETRFL
jgi:hypothetical protein